jgi:thiamine transporter ThiT
MKDQLKKLVLSAMFIAIGLVLPFVTGQVPEIGNMLLPMHIPVMLSGLVCGWQYGAAVGFITPLLRSFIFGKPFLFPNAFAMAFELAAYGLVIGLVFLLLKKKGVISLYISLVTSMLAGRAVWGAVMWLILVGGKGFTLAAFVSGAFTTAIPGIILQLVLIPAIMMILKRARLVNFGDK